VNQRACVTGLVVETAGTRVAVERRVWGGGVLCGLYGETVHPGVSFAARKPGNTCRNEPPVV